MKKFQRIKPEFVLSVVGMKTVQSIEPRSVPFNVGILAQPIESGMMSTLITNAQANNVMLKAILDNAVFGLSVFDDHVLLSVGFYGNLIKINEDFPFIPAKSLGLVQSLRIDYIQLRCYSSTSEKSQGLQKIESLLTSALSHCHE